MWAGKKRRLDRHRKYRFFSCSVFFPSSDTPVPGPGDQVEGDSRFRLLTLQSQQLRLPVQIRLDKRQATGSGLCSPLRQHPGRRSPVGESRAECFGGSGAVPPRRTISRPPSPSLARATEYPSCLYLLATNSAVRSSSSMSRIFICLDFITGHSAASGERGYCDLSACSRSARSRDRWPCGCSSCMGAKCGQTIPIRIPRLMQEARTMALAPRSAMTLARPIALLNKDHNTTSLSTSIFFDVFFQG